MADTTETPSRYENPMAQSIKSAIIAVVLFAVLAGAYLYYNRKPELFAGQVVRVNTFQMPIKTKTDEGADLPQTVGQQLLVLVQMHIQNKTEKTLTVQDITGDLQLPDGTRRSLATGGHDFSRVFEVYPELTPMKGDPILPDTKIAPKQSIDGLAILDYPIQQKQWDMRRGLSMTVEFTNNTTLTMQAP